MFVFILVLFILQEFRGINWPAVFATELEGLSRFHCYVGKVLASTAVLSPSSEARTKLKDVGNMLVQIIPKLRAKVRITRKRYSC